MFEEKMISSLDGTKLFMRKDMADQPKAVIVIVHGLAEHLNRYDYITDKLLEDNFSVYRYDQRGHGRSEGKRVYFDTYTQIVDDAKSIFDLAKSENPNKRIFMIGHSMGGFTATLFGTKFPTSADGIVLSGALTRYTNLAFGPSPLKEPVDTYLPNSLGDGVCSDPLVVEAYEQDPLVAKEISVGLINMLFDGIDYLKENASEFIAPTLIMHGLEDGLVSPNDSIQFLKR